MTAAQEKIIQNTISFVQEELADAEGGHDWFHVERVYKLSKALAVLEKADLFVVALGALLHDVADAKFHDGDESIGPKKARQFLEAEGVEETVIQAVIHIVKFISYKGGHTKAPYRTPELDVVQDADRLDAIGAIGIARCFNYGGFKNRPLYDPDIKPNLKMDKETYQKGNAPSLNHFYEKLLLLKDLMHTEAAKKAAEARHRFLENYLEQFLKEWDGQLH
ncbi:MAG: HD domain-containing protein [Bacteroidetes bacterium]|nr:HD domain-containing protein [Bacteroidota bacterium]